MSSIKYIHVENMRSDKGNYIPNQFIIYAPEGTYFQSYRTIIAFKKVGGGVILDPMWNCSVTTGKYRNEFLRETKRETERNIKDGNYKVKSLNPPSKEDI